MRVPIKRLSTGFTEEGFLPRVGHHVALAVPAGGELFSTELAGERLLARVGPHVQRQT